MKMEANWSHLNMICKDDDSCMEAFRKVLKDELPKEMELYTESLASKEYKEAAMLVHKIKHKFSLVNMESAYNFSVSYEEELLDNDNVNQQTFDLYVEQLVAFLK